MSQDFSLWENHSLVRTRLALRKRQKPGKPWTEAAGSSKANGWFWFWFGVEMMNFCCSFWLFFFFFLPFKDIIKAFLQSFLFLFFSKQLWPVLSVCQCEFKNSVFFIAVYKSLVVPVFFLFFLLPFLSEKDKQMFMWLAKFFQWRKRLSVLFHKLMNTELIPCVFRETCFSHALKLSGWTGEEQSRGWPVTCDMWPVRWRD